MKVMSNRIAMVLSIVIFSLSLIFQTAHAEIYKWVDEKGTVNFTEDPATIPEKYRDKVKSRTTEEDLMSPEERARAKKQYEEEVKEKLKKEGKEYDAKGLEKRVKEIMEQSQKQKGECEIISYSQYEVNSGKGTVNLTGDYYLTGTLRYNQETCVHIVIRNNDRELKTITQRNIVATTSRPIVTKSEFNPKPVLIRIQPGETYRGSICFDRQLPIAKLELQGL